jgi:hypothetical protein
MGVTPPNGKAMSLLLETWMRHSPDEQDYDALHFSLKFFFRIC